MIITDIAASVDNTFLSIESGSDRTLMIYPDGTLAVLSHFDDETEVLGVYGTTPEDVTELNEKLYVGDELGEPESVLALVAFPDDILEIVFECGVRLVLRLSDGEFRFDWYLSVGGPNVAFGESYTALERTWHKLMKHELKYKTARKSA